MQMEKEITVLVDSDYETLQKDLYDKGFKIEEEYNLNDVYMLDERVDISNMNYLDILKNCILVRNIVGFEMELLYKYKKYDVNGDILEQGKVKCPITDVSKAIKFMETIHYKRMFEINDDCIVYTNGKNKLAVQLVNDKYIFIEMESDENNNKSIEELENDLLSYNLPIDKNNFFVKKAEMMLKEVLEKMMRE